MKNYKKKERKTIKKNLASYEFSPTRRSAKKEFYKTVTWQIRDARERLATTRLIDSANLNSKLCLMRVSKNNAFWAMLGLSKKKIINSITELFELIELS